MCTAITFQTKDFYFGRTLDHTCSYGETVTVTPRKYPLPFRHGKTLEEHHAIVGMAYVLEEYPLYYDAINEKGLAIAGLNFVGNTHYRGPEEGKDNVAQFELIPWLLGRCASVNEARQALERLCITPTAFRPELPPSQLHWLIADRQEAIVLESMADGLHIYDNPVGVLTNNPPFDRQLFRLNDYRALSPRLPENCFAPGLELKAYSFGMGALGLPGDLTSQSRFVRAAFTRLHSVTEESEQASVSQFFHILGTVSQTRGCCDTGEGGLEFTQYTSCCNADKGIYYYTTYENRQITAVDLRREDLDGSKLVSYPLIRQEQVRMMN